MRIHTVIFDLDGTLIDSARSILNSIQAAFDEVGIEPMKPLTHDLIGPPLKDLFITLLNEARYEKLPRLIEAFKHYYDVLGYKETQAYESVTEMLDELIRMKLNLYIATNKRILPTLKILDLLSWKERFEGVYALDCFEPVLESKTAMLKHLCKDFPHARGGAVYVGDRAEDANAAEGASLPFFWASWGYDNNIAIPDDVLKIPHPSMLPKAVIQYS